MNFTFEEATREKLNLRLALMGVSGAGKTYTSLAIATMLLGADRPSRDLVKRIAVIDSERGSARKYGDGRPFYFSTLNLSSFAPETYVAAINAAAKAGFEAVIIDSLSHEWAGTDGALEQVDRNAVKGNTYVAWGKITPRHNAVIDALMTAPMHVIATLRSKQAYEQDTDENGKKIVRKLGLQPVQREGIEFEFDVVVSMDLDNSLTVVKSRCADKDGRQSPPDVHPLGKSLA